MLQGESLKLTCYVTVYVGSIYCVSLKFFMIKVKKKHRKNSSLHCELGWPVAEMAQIMCFSLIC